MDLHCRTSGGRRRKRSMQADSIYWVRSAGDCKVQLHHSHRHTHSHMSGPHHDLVIVCSPPLLPAYQYQQAPQLSSIVSLTRTVTCMRALTCQSQLLRPAYGSMRAPARVLQLQLQLAAAYSRTTRCVPVVPAVQCWLWPVCACACVWSCNKPGSTTRTLRTHCQLTYMHGLLMALLR